MEIRIHGPREFWPGTCPRPHRPRAESAKTQVPSFLGPTGRPRSIFHAGQLLPHAQGGRAAHFTGRHLQWGTGWPRWLAIGDRGGTGGGGGHGAELESWELAFQVPKREPRFLRTARKHTRAQEHSLSNPIPGFLDSAGGGERRKLQFPDDERLAPSHYQTRRGTTVGRAPARQCLPLSGRMPQAIRPLCLSLSGHLPRELLMPPHATPPQSHPTGTITPSRAPPISPDPTPMPPPEGDTSGPRDDRGKELAGNSPQVEGESGSKADPCPGKP